MSRASRIVNYKKNNGESNKKDNGRAIFGGIQHDLQHLLTIKKKKKEHDPSPDMSYTDF